MSINIKPSKGQVSKIIQFGGSFGAWLANLAKKSTNKCCFSFR